MQNQNRSLFNSTILQTPHGDYQILCTIEFNSHVSIHHALSLNTHEKVVIKFASSEYEFYENLIQSCEIVGTISHPNIIKIHDYFILTNELSNDLFVVIMDDYSDINANKIENQRSHFEFLDDIQVDELDYEMT